MNHYTKIEPKRKPKKNQIQVVNNCIEGFKNVGFHGMFLEMSLGKTKAAIDVSEIMHVYGKLDRVLVVCPKAIQSVWTEEIPKDRLQRSPPVIWENKTTWKLKKSLDRLFKQELPILIVRLELFQKKNDVLQEFLQKYFEKPTMTILDESSKIKNMATKRTPRLIEYTRGAKYRTALTGTPWTESPLDIFSQMEFLHTGFWFSYRGKWTISIANKHWYIFRGRYAVMQDIVTNEGKKFKTMVGTRRVDEIARKIRPYITQQKKKDWQDLPEKIFQPLFVEMDSVQAKAYTQMKEEMILEYGDELLTAGSAITLLTRLRQIAGGFYPVTGEPISTTLRGVELILEDVSEYSGKVLISCAYVAEVDGIVAALSKVYGKDQVISFQGKTKDRDGAKKRFETTAQFLVGTEQVMAYGHNWQFCSLMYRYSLAFSYERNSQLVDRIHRPGMKGDAIYKSVTHTGTVQEKVLKAFKKKKDVVEMFDGLTMREFLE